MSCGFLQPRHIFGVKGDVKDNAWYLEENVVAYPAGHNVVLYHTESKSQKFIAGTEGTRGISCMAVSPSRRYVGIAERAQRGVISIFDWHSQKKRKVLTSSECASGEYVSMCFSQNKLLLTLGGGPDWTLVLWNWEKAKALAVVRVSNAAGAPLTQCSFNPVDPSVVCVTGEGIFKAFRIVDDAFKPMPNLLGSAEPRNFTSHLWLGDDRIVLGTDSGQLLLSEAGELLGVLACSPANGRAVTCLAALSDGFLCGQAGGDVRVFQAVDDDAGYYRETKSVNVADAAAAKLGGAGAGAGAGSGSSAAATAASAVTIDVKKTAALAPGDARKAEAAAAAAGGKTAGEASGGAAASPAAVVASGDESGLATPPLAPKLVESVVALAVSPSEERALVTLNTNQILVLTLASNDLLKPSEVACELLSDSFHRHGLGGAATITGLDLCIRKPLAVTCGLDCSVRVWNYIENRCELAKVFGEEAHSVSFHPSGLHLLVGFSDKLRLMNLLMDDIRTSKELPIKGCRECRFSNGGHLFAAVNGNTIQVFNTYTTECVRTMRGHNGKVRSLFWSANDSQLVSAGIDGAVYQWDLKENKRDGEYVKKGCSYATALSNKAGDAVFAAGSDRVLREVEFPVSVVTKEIDCGAAALSQLAMSSSQRMLFGAVGDEDKPGAVRSFKFPLTGDFIEYAALAAPATRLRLSWEDQFLFVAGEDGALQVFEVREKDARALAAAQAAGEAGAEQQAAQAAQTPASVDVAAVQALAYSEEVLVTKSDLEEKHALMLELKSKVDELTLHNEYQLRLKDMNYNEKIKELTEKFTQDLEQDKNRYELLREEKNDLEMEYADKIKQVEERHQERMQEVENSFQSKIIREVERFQQLCRERDLQRQQCDKQQELLAASHAQYIQEITLDYEHQLSEDRELKQSIAGEVDESNKEFFETMRQLEGDIDKEIELLKNKFESKLAAEREATLRFKGENGIMKKKFTALQKDIEVQREDIKAVMDKEQDLILQIRALEKEITQLRAEIRDRDETIGEKEKRIYDLKKKNQELDKFKFVLDYKIKELKRQIEPRENEIGDMKEQIKAMDRELEQYHKSNADLDLMIGELRSKLDGMQKAIMANRQRLSEQKTKMSRFVSSLDECSRLVLEPQALRAHVQKIYEAFVSEQVKSETIDVDIKKEYRRQKDFLEKSADALKKRLEADVHKHKEDNMKIMESNMRLIAEIADLREEIRVARLKSIVESSDVAKPGAKAGKGSGSGSSSSSGGGGKSSKAPSKPPAPTKRQLKGTGAPAPALELAPSSADATDNGSGLAGMTPQEQKLIEEQRHEIGRLKTYMAELEDKMAQARPLSREQRSLAPL